MNTHIHGGDWLWVAPVSETRVLYGAEKLIMFNALYVELQYGFQPAAPTEAETTFLPAVTSFRHSGGATLMTALSLPPFHFSFMISSYLGGGSLYEGAEVSSPLLSICPVTSS